MFYFTIILLLSSCANAQQSSFDKLQTTANTLTFFLQAPGNCLKVDSDLPINAPSKNLAALWIRAAFHDMATYDATDPYHPAGPVGTLVFTTNQTENAGLENTIADRFVPNKNNISNADIIALAGIVSIGHCGGPIIPMNSGRIDSKIVYFNDTDRIPKPNDSLNTVKLAFTRMGLNYLDMAVLVTGSHTMGGVHGKISPMITNETFIPFDDTPGIFDNRVFKFTLKGECALPIDCAIANDPGLRPYIKLFADDQTAFFKQYSISFQKMMKLNSIRLSDDFNLAIAVHSHLMEEGNMNKPSTNASVGGFGYNEALRCLSISKTKYSDGQTESALKFAQKSLHLCDTREGQEWLLFVQKTSSAHSTTSKPTNTHNLRNRKQPQEPETPQQRPFTPQQQQGINNIKKHKQKGDLYAILGLTKDCSDSDIKKAYRKLALQYHPDKCGAPGTDDAFKAIGHAFTVLSDSNKRATFDHMGVDPDSSQARMSSNGFSGFSSGSQRYSNRPQQHRGFNTEISPEELFNMFFNQHTNQRGHSNFGFEPPHQSAHENPRTRNRRPKPSNNSNSNQNAGQPSYLQLLPLLGLLVFLFSSFLGAWDASEYSLNSANGYRAEMATRSHNVKYFVNNANNFRRKYYSNDYKLAALERRIESQHYNTLQHQCNHEREMKNYKIASSKGFFKKTDYEALNRAKAIRTPSCEALSRW